MKNILLLLAAIFVLFLLGCTSIPHVDRPVQLEEGKYRVIVDKDYLENPEEFDYAINAFVKGQGKTSYDVEQQGPNTFYITTPGKTEVKDLPKVKHSHTGRTVMLFGCVIGGGLTFVGVIALLSPLGGLFSMGQ